MTRPSMTAERAKEERTITIPTSCWRPKLGTGIAADAEMYPGGCPDPDWCRGNRACYWKCTDLGESDDGF